MGHAAEPPTVLQTHPCNLQNTGGQESVPTREGEPGEEPSERRSTGVRAALLPPLVTGVHWTPVSFPADDRLWQTVDLALEPGHAGLLGVHCLRLDVEVCHGCRESGEVVSHSVASSLAAYTTHAYL